jgi:restriction endonuclease S subunit
MKFLDLFNEITKGDFALTDEAVYASIQNNDELVPLYGGNKEHSFTDRKVSISAKTKKGNQITIFSGEGIIISLDGSAGSMTYKKGEKFALNHHAGFITLKPEMRNRVSIKYFALFFQNFYRSLSVSEGSKTLSLDLIYGKEIDLPAYDIQVDIVKTLQEPFRRLRLLSFLKERYIEIFNKEIVFKYNSFQAKNVPINECISYMSGNSGLTEEFIYHTLQIEGARFKVLSSATEDRTMMGKVPLCELNGKVIKVFEKAKGLLVTRNGKAGRTRYLERGNYTINDHAYILFVKDTCKFEIDLKWLSIQYRTTFLEYASSSDNGTWNMTGFFQHTILDIPHISEQKRVVTHFEKIEQRINSIEVIEYKFNELLSKEIAM